MEFISRGESAFFIALYYEEDPNIIMKNAGSSKLLVLTVTDYGKISKKIWIN